MNAPHSGAQAVPPLMPLFAPPDIEMQRRADGSVLLRSRKALSPPDEHLLVWMARWADEAPDRPFLAERDASGQWRHWRYADAWRDAQATGAGLLARGHSSTRPLLILAPNGLAHARFLFGAMAAAIPVAPVTPQYALSPAGHAKIAKIADLVNPSAVLVDDATKYEDALAMLAARGVPVVSAQELFASKAATARLPTITGATPAKILFTSGSTGQPKAVVYTHRMMTSNLQMTLELWPFLNERNPVLIDWLPWTHVFGANNNINTTLARGGTMHIDAGSPRPGGLEQTLANLREIAPTLYFNVPAGFAGLLSHLENDRTLCTHFFSRLDAIFYAGAAISGDTWERLQRLAVAQRGSPIPITCGWGATETGPTATLIHALLDGPGNIGTPVPGGELKLAPVAGKYELRFKSPSVTTGYLGNPEATRLAFDEEGFYCTGDAGRLADPDDPNKGLVFDGRIAEDFKLATGTWVSVGPLRVALLAAADGLIAEALILAPNRPYSAALVWLDPVMAKSLDTEALRTRLRAALARLDAGQSASSLRIERLAIAASPPSMDAGEINEKAYLVQAVARDRRASEIDALYAEPADPQIITLSVITLKGSKA